LIDVEPTGLASWCQENLGSAVSGTIFTSGHLSAVVGVTLEDGRRVVVKVRPSSRRIAGCVEVQRHLHSSGFPCPEPLAGPSAFAPGTMATAETYVQGGEQLDPTMSDRPALFAGVLADMVGIALAGTESRPSSLDPPPPWAWPDLHALWPAPDDLEADLNVEEGPAWLDELGREVRGRLLSLSSSMPSVVGHADFDSDNIRWETANSKEVRAVHDWDSVAALPEPALAGLASAIFTATGEAGTEATFEESELFLDSYQERRGLEWSRPEVEVAWAAGLWVRAFDAKKAFVRGDPTPGRRLLDEVPSRTGRMRG
jgi:Ser/Thr protein kinase RdoA (MazF antagonist)